MMWLGKTVIYLALLILCFSCTVKTEKEKTNKEVIPLQKVTPNVEVKYITAASGLNYRDKPKGTILGKLEYGTKVEIVSHSNIFESIDDGSNTIKGEWLGVNINDAVVYLFGGYLSKEISNNIYKTYTWNDELCSYSGVFNPKNYNKQEIESCYKIIYQNSFSIDSSPWVFKLSDIDKLNRNDLETEYTTKTKEINNLILPKQGNWKQYKQQVINEMEECYKLYSISYKAYTTGNYEVLNEFWKSDDLLEEYAKGLQGTDEELMSAWKKLVAEQAKRNGSPQSVWDEFYENKSAHNWQEYAKVRIMTFGWGNAANHHINRFKGHEHFDDFYALFVSTKELSCDEP